MEFGGVSGAAGSAAGLRPCLFVRAQIHLGSLKGILSFKRRLRTSPIIVELLD